MRLKVPQFKGIPLLGALQVQFQNSLMPVTFSNYFMIVLTFWYTSGHQIAAAKAPWFNFWMFIFSVPLIVLFYMLLDYILFYPSRIAFINRQTCKHENPAMECVLRIEGKVNDMDERMKAIEERLNIHA